MLFRSKAILADPEKNMIGFTANDYYLFSYDSENGFSLLEQQANRLQSAVPADSPLPNPTLIANQNP